MQSTVYGYTSNEKRQNKQVLHTLPPVPQPNRSSDGSSPRREGLGGGEATAYNRQRGGGTHLSCVSTVPTSAPSLLVPRLCCENTPAPPPGARTESAALNCDRELFVRDGPPLVYWPTTRKENTLISRVSHVSCWSPKSGCGEGDLAIYIIFTIVCVHVCEGKSF